MNEIRSDKYVNTLVATLLLMSSVCAGAGVQPGENLAMGKPYRLSATPTQIWESYILKASGEYPDYLALLTDGQRTTSPTGYHVSPQAVSFANVPFVDVTIDLGSTHPIAEIYSHHGARPTAGVPLPRAEAYYVSDDGVNYSQVAWYDNPKDPSVLKAAAELEHFYQGELQFTSGAIQTRGRYVKVRTFTYPGHYNMFRSIHTDEIFVIAGDHDPNDVRFDSVDLIEDEAGESLDADVLGYEVNPVDWLARWKRQPLSFTLWPHGYHGSTHLEMGCDGVYPIVARSVIRTTKLIDNVTLEYVFPASIEIVAHSLAHPYESKTFEENGRKYRLVRFAFTPKSIKINSVTQPFVLARAPGDLPLGELGKLQVRWQYDLDGQPHTEGVDTFMINIVPAIASSTPKRFRTDVWLPHALRHISDKDQAVDELLAFYQRIGFRGTRGQSRDWIYHAAKSRGMHVAAESGVVANALMFDKFGGLGLRDTIRNEQLFVYYPESDSSRYGVCPEVLLSESFYSTIVEGFERTLATTDDVYINWEPYMFSKRGCRCDRCKQAYASFAKLTEDQVESQWPEVIADQDAEAYNAFISEQLGQVMLTYDRAIQDAGRNLGRDPLPVFEPSISPEYFDSAQLINRWHNPNAYVRGIRRMVLWLYPYSFEGFSHNIHNYVGDNLFMLSTWNSVTNVMNAHGKSTRDTAYLLLGDDQGDRYQVFPRDLSFHTLLAFVFGFEGYSTYSRNLQTTESLRELARAHTQIARYEDIVFDQPVLDNVRATLLTKIPQIELAGNPNGTPVFVRSWQMDSGQLIALGNDSPYEVHVRLSIASLPTGQYVLTDPVSGEVFAGADDKAFSSDALEQGIAIPMDSKRWRFLELASATESVAEDLVQVEVVR